MSITLPTYADQERVYFDIGKTEGGDDSRDNLVIRADEDASSRLEAIFLNLIEFDDEPINNPSWFTDIATRLTTALFWFKSNNTQDEREAVEKIIQEANKIKVERFFPQEIR